ncbi:MAG: 2,4-dichlorophenoxyacetate dioxygenase [Betaproteobacteria bacterium RIFCSPLOWO2_02_64_14]|nr:MAG: 2,4-dichlorophenoxyacetate dioxygenase [Betaproteobacteria bacterium RIFCSPLOWO2_02_64_14]
MPVQFRVLTTHIGAEVEGIDLREPLSSAQAEEIHAAMDRYAVLVFHDQPLTNEQHLAFTSVLGPLENTANILRTAADFRLPPVFADVSNLDGRNQPYGAEDRRRLFAIGNRLWHSDSSFKAVPAKYSLLRAVRIPSKGGNTEFAHMGAAYEALDDETKALIEDRVCEHSQLFSRESVGFTDFTPEERERLKPVRQRLVRTLPRTGRKSIYLSSHAGTIVGWPLPEARLLLRDLTEHATQREFVYSHPWRVDDLVMWDNRQTMHRGRPFPAGEARDVRRTTIGGEAPTVEQAIAA